jgi:hypothetical protein
MRTVVSLVFVCTSIGSAACSDAPESPLRPTAVSVTQPQTQAQSGTDLPFGGSFTISTTGTVNCPPTCPPTVLTVHGTLNGTATHLGRLTAVSVEAVNLAAATSTGTLTLTAANGDQLFARTAGAEESFVPPNISTVRILAEIVGGTGRFSSGTGSLTIRYTAAIDFAAQTSAGDGSIEGRLDLNR